jgi:hypothetical protein
MQDFIEAPRTMKVPARILLFAYFLTLYPCSRVHGRRDTGAHQLTRWACDGTWRIEAVGSQKAFVLARMLYSLIAGNPRNARRMK